ncbi:hypothetical protein [Pelagibius sp.]|uniref:hypothetical protein n=1 Tax=Pelagibius sp. TaxID=1931238 RepID=UPI0026132C3A|nr:hypothetical protein [Pelagibius sp.]
MIGARDLAFVGCRLLSLYVLWVTLTYLAHSILLVFGVMAWSSYASSSLMLLVTHLAVFVALWFGAGRIAGMVASETAATSEDHAGEWSRQAALSLAVVVLGLWVLIQQLPIFVSFLLQFIGEERRFALNTDLDRLVWVILTTGLGVLCVFGSRAIAQFIGRLRRW